VQPGLDLVAEIAVKIGLDIADGCPPRDEEPVKGLFLVELVKGLTPGPLL